MIRVLRSGNESLSALPLSLSLSLSAVFFYSSCRGTRCENSGWWTKIPRTLNLKRETKSELKSFNCFFLSERFSAAREKRKVRSK
jgi:hypothetical protein